MSDSDAIEQRRKAELDQRMEQRAQQREVEKQQRRAKDVQEGVDESVPQFLARFDAQRRELGEQVRALTEDAALPAEERKERVSVLNTRLDELQKTLSNAAFFLPAYELRQGQAGLKELREALQRAVELLAPKKKFAFGARNKAAAGPQQPAAASEGAGAADAATQQLLAKLGIVDRQERIHDRVGERLVRAPGSMGGRDLWISNARNCEIWVADWMGGVRLDRIEGCRLFLGPVAGSVHLEHCVDSVVFVASRQIRIHAAQRVDFYVHVLSNPIIEHSSQVRFAPYALDYEELAEHMRQADLDLAVLNARARPATADTSAEQPQPFEPFVNKWDQVNDFNWLRQQQSPNWSIIDPSERVPPPRLPVEVAAPSKQP